jgi:hypothetical protein
MAHRHAEIFNQLGSCSATESKCNSYQRLCCPNRSPRIGRSTGGKTFAEDFACAIRILAAKATHFDKAVQSLTTHRQVSPLSLVARMHAARFLLTQRTGLCWLLGTSVCAVDDFALDCFISLRAVACTDQRTQEHFSCLPGLCSSSSHVAEVDRKVLLSTTRT